MSKPIGFVILSHNNPHQLLRLVLCLQRIYDNPPIAIHHDFGQSALLREDFPTDVKFVTPHVNTRWGKISQVEAALKALELLYQNTAPEWFFLLSASDYPALPPSRVLAELSSSKFDVLMDYREVPKLSDPRHHITYKLSLSKYDASLTSSHFNPPFPPPENPALRHFILDENIELAWRRYLALTAWLPVIRNGVKFGRYALYLPFDGLSSPFTAKFKCYYGDHWFAAKGNAAEVLLNPTDKHLQLRRYLRLRHNVDECYFHTVLANSPGLRISGATKRFVHWPENPDNSHEGSHPNTLDQADLPAITMSGAYFARKFAPGSSILDQIDKLIL